MTGESNSDGMMTVGLDVGDKYVHACFLNHDGKMVNPRPRARRPTNRRVRRPDRAGG